MIVPDAGAQLSAAKDNPSVQSHRSLCCILNLDMGLEEAVVPGFVKELGALGGMVERLSCRPLDIIVRSRDGVGSEESLRPGAQCVGSSSKGGDFDELTTCLSSRKETVLVRTRTSESGFE